MAARPGVESHRTSLEADVRPREVWGWAMYDFANSGYTTVVITAVFNAYFVSVVAGSSHWATFAWTAALSVSYLLIMLAGPVIGAYADAHAAKKQLLAITTFGCVLGTALLVGLTVHESLAVTRQVPTWGWLALGGSVLVAAGIVMERRDTGPMESGRRLVDVVGTRFH